MTVCTVTEAAKSHINNVCVKHDCYAVSLNLKGGGCAGFEYTWGTVEKDDVDSNDCVIDTGKGKLVIGSTSIPFLEGTEVDYITEMLGSKMVISNPNVESACGCGVSISF
jgi:iron-sulfur cluster assembly protein